MKVRAFRGLRPRADLAARIPSLPYDVVTADEARALVRDDPYTFLHVVRPDADLDPALDAHDPRVYERGCANFRAMVDRGWLVRDAEPALYVYRLRSGDHAQIGVLGAAAVDDYAAGRILRHEHTRPEKVEDRVRLNAAIGAHPGPVFLCHRPDARIRGLLAEIAAAPPAVEFPAADGVEHALWVVAGARDRERLESALAALPAAYIADGHHRAEAASRLAAARGGAFLAGLFSADELRVLGYHRVVRDLGGLDQDEFLRRVAGAFEIAAVRPGPIPGGPGRFGMYLAGGWRELIPRDGHPGGSGDPVERLDVSVLSDRLLGPVLGIRDLRTDRRIDFVGGGKGAAALESAVQEGRAAIAFALHPTSVDDVMSVADAGRVMPPKSTWFEPKLRSGMVVQLFEP